VRVDHAGPRLERWMETDLGAFAVCVGERSVRFDRIAPELRAERTIRQFRRRRSFGWLWLSSRQRSRRAC